MQLEQLLKSSTTLKELLMKSSLQLFDGATVCFCSG